MLARGTQTRQQLRTKRRRLERNLLDAKFGWIDSAKDFDPAFDALIQLHQSRWTGQGFDDSFSSPTFTAFHRAFAKRSLESGTLRLYYLKIDGSIAAIYYCFKAGTKTTYYNAGYDEKWRKYSVGVLTLAFAMEQAIQEGSLEFDFLQGDETYKTHWATGERWDWRARFSNLSKRGRLLWWLLQPTHVFAVFLRQPALAPMRLGVKTSIRRIKAFLRGD